MCIEFLFFNSNDIIYGESLGNTNTGLYYVQMLLSDTKENGDLGKSLNDGRYGSPTGMKKYIKQGGYCDMLTTSVLERITTSRPTWAI